MDIALRPQSIVSVLLAGIIGLLVLMMSQSVSQVKVQTQIQQNTRQVFTVVIADDEPANLERTSFAAGILIKALGFEPRILPAVTYTQVMELAMIGNNGEPVNAVFLDGDYSLSQNPHDWVIPGSKFDEVADGIFLATSLRVRGFTGPIFLVSGGAESIMKKPGSERFSAAFKKTDFWLKPLQFLDQIQKILR